MPGQIGRFQIGRTLGQGASCKVKIGLDTQSKRKVAIKIMNKTLDDETKKLVITEVEALSVLKGHPNILEIIEHGEDVYESKGR
jgi:serine/threonine protein kinase